MIVLGIDIETTGLEPGDHRIVEVYAGLWRLETRERIYAFEQRIDPQRAILADAQRVHGISNLDLVGKPIWPEVAPKLAVIMSKADFVVAHNGIWFDLPFINYEMKRVGQPQTNKTVIDTIDARWASPVGKSPTLAELCFACDVPYDPAKAHAAAYDVEVMMECFFRANSWGRFPLPDSLRIAA